MLKSKNFKTKLLVLLAIFLVIFTNFAYADNEEVQTPAISGFEEASTSLSQEELIATIKKSDIFLIEQSTTIDYPLAGNAFIIAKDVTINNIIDGNVFILAEEVNITANSYIYSDAYICAERINIDGYLYDLYSMSEKLTIGENANILRDIHSACSTFTLNGTINRTADLGVDILNINSETANIGGDLNYVSSQEFDIKDDIVSGSINYSTANAVETTTQNAIVEQVKDLLRTLIYALVLILILVFAMKNFTSKLENNLTKKLWPVVGYGALGLIATPIVCIILLCTVIGIWASIALLFVYIFLFSATLAITSLAIGKLICTKINKQTNGMVILFSMLAALVIYILCNIPILGGLVSLAKTLIGFGLVIYTIINYKKQ